jgi:hypothetical protein
MVEVPALTRLVSKEHILRFGEPDLALAYDESKALPATIPALKHLLVMCWRPTQEVDITTFATIGMSARPVPGASYRLELHFSLRGRIADDVERSVTRFLANLANYPWDHERALDWWHVLRNPGRIPAFPNCSSVLLHPRFTPEGWDHLHHENEVVRLLNVVPITEAERERAAAATRDLLQDWEKDDIDIFVDRTTRS